jgi:hypothetical protein
MYNFAGNFPLFNFYNKTFITEKAYFVSKLQNLVQEKLFTIKRPLAP